jgi:hypothetical protein
VFFTRVGFAFQGRPLSAQVAVGGALQTFREQPIKTGAQLIRDWALQRLEHLSSDNWHDMAEADARLIADQLAKAGPLTATTRIEAEQAAKRLLIFAQWARSYALAATILARRS